MKITKVNMDLEECMNVGGNIQWDESSTISLGGRNILRTAYMCLNLL